MITIIVIIHAMVCILLIGIILIQAGRGGGLIEGFSGVESMFGTKTNTFLSRTTTVLAVLFFITCLSLALLSLRQSRSLMRDVKIPKREEKAKDSKEKVLDKKDIKEPQKEEPKPEAPKTE